MDAGEHAGIEQVNQDEIVNKIVDALKLVIEKGVMEEMGSQHTRTDKLLKNIIEHLKNDIVTG